jgi:DNA-directed RNA polymerase beta subunit
MSNIKESKNDNNTKETKETKESKENKEKQIISFIPKKVYEPIESIKNDDIVQDDMMGYLIGAIDDTGIIGYSIDSFNQLVEEGIPQIITKSVNIDFVMKNTRDQTPTDRERESYRILFGFNGAKVGMPIYSTYPAGNIQPLYPSKCRINFQTYSGPITTGAHLTVVAKYKNGREETKSVDIPTFQISAFPIMLKCVKDHLYNCSREMLKNLEEDPNEYGGYFIINGRELAVDLLENIGFNKLHVFRTMQQNEILRGEFISQPGNAWDISSQCSIRYMSNGSITVEITSIKFSKARIPFYLIYRMFGMTSDKDIIKSIVFDLSSDSYIITNMINIVNKALQVTDKDFANIANVLDREKIVEHISAHITKNITSTAYKKWDNAIQYLNQNLLNNLDKVFLPHMGITAEHRAVKLQYLGMLIHKFLLVHMDILKPTDRDSYKNKRVHGSGVSLAKALKTRFNISVTMPILNSIRRELLNSPWESIDSDALIGAFKNNLSISELNDAIAKAITAGNKIVTIKHGKSLMNRISTQPMERKNTLNTIITLRTVNTHNSSSASKQTERADLMRRVHPTYIRHICLCKSIDTGEKVGLTKELAITTSVCQSIDPIPFKMQLLQDPDIIPLSKVDSVDIIRKNYAKILVDGAWIGCAENAHKLVAKYRALRREGKIVERKASISWDSATNDIEFWFDVGRLVAPVIIVDSNIEEYDKACMSGNRDVKFVQNMRFTKDHAIGLLTGNITFDNLVEEGIVEYISIEEQDNCLIATSHEELFANKHNHLMQYTHVDVEASIFGLAAHVGPYSNNTQSVRVTYLTNHGRQACGWYCFSWPYRVDKNRIFQFYNQMPLVKTISHKYVVPNGSNIIVAYSVYYGYNMEDSSIVNKSSVERGLFDGSFFRFEKAELEKGEKFGAPDAFLTKGLKPNISYAKLVGECVQSGTIVVKGDVLIGRYAKIQRKVGEQPGADSKFQFVDKSVIYKLEEPAIVDAVWKSRGANDELFILIRLRHERPIVTGDKFSSRMGNKSIAALLVPASDMMFVESDNPIMNGITPDMIINPHSFPTRMVIGQIIEATISKVCAKLGTTVDGTAFRKINPEQILQALETEGFRYNGCETMRNGFTGEYMDAAIFIAPTYHQRLQKFVLDDNYAVGGSGPTNAITGQPLSGKSVLGSFRLGEMEQWVFNAQGNMALLYEKFYIDSNWMVVTICRGCGNLEIYNKKKGIYKCNSCGQLADISTVNSARASIAFIHELITMNIKIRFGLKPRVFT